MELPLNHNPRVGIGLISNNPEVATISVYSSNPEPAFESCAFGKFEAAFEFCATGTFDSSFMLVLIHAFCAGILMGTSCISARPQNHSSQESDH